MDKKKKYIQHSNIYREKKKIIIVKKKKKINLYIYFNVPIHQ